MGNLPNIKGATEFGASRGVKIQVNYNSCRLWFEKRNAGKKTVQKVLISKKSGLVSRGLRAWMFKFTERSNPWENK